MRHAQQTRTADTHKMVQQHQCEHCPFVGTYKALRAHSRAHSKVIYSNCARNQLENQPTTLVQPSVADHSRAPQPIIPDGGSRASTSQTTVVSPSNSAYESNGAADIVCKEKYLQQAPHCFDKDWVQLISQNPQVPSTFLNRVLKLVHRIPMTSTTKSALPPNVASIHDLSQGQVYKHHMQLLDTYVSLTFTPTM